MPSPSFKGLRWPVKREWGIDEWLVGSSRGGLKKKKKNSANQWKLAWPNIIFQSSKSLSSFRMTRFQCACTNFPFNFCINKKITSTAARTVAHAYCHITSPSIINAPWFTCTVLFNGSDSSLSLSPLQLSPDPSLARSLLERKHLLPFLIFFLSLVTVCVSECEWVGKWVSFNFDFKIES